MDNKGNTVLMYAIKHKLNNICENVLTNIKNNLDLKIQNSVTGDTTLMVAIKHSNISVCKQILYRCEMQNEFGLNVQNNSGETALILAIETCSIANDMVNMLIEWSTKYTSKGNKKHQNRDNDDDDNEFKSQEKVKVIDFNIQNNSGNSSFTSAMLNGEFDVALLIFKDSKNNLNLNKANKVSGQTPLMIAIEKGNIN